MFNQDNEQHFLKLGASLFDHGRYDEAKVEFEKALSLNSSDPDTHNWLGRVALIQKRYEDAEHSFRKACGLKPEEPIYHDNLGLAVSGLKRYSEAAEAKYFKLFCMILIGAVTLGLCALLMTFVHNYEWNEQVLPLSLFQLYWVVLCIITGGCVVFSYQTNKRRLLKISLKGAGLLFPIYLLSVGISAIHDEHIVFKYLHFGGYQAVLMGSVIIIGAVAFGVFIIRLVGRNLF